MGFVGPISRLAALLAALCGAYGREATLGEVLAAVRLQRRARGA